MQNKPKEKTIIRCKKCNNEFNPIFPNQKFCSELCKHIYNLEKRRIQYVFDKAEPKESNNICLYCKNEMKPYGSKKFCSEKCRRLYRNLTRNKSGIKRLRILEQNISKRYCIECGKEIKLVKNYASTYHLKKFCCRECCANYFKKNKYLFEGHQRNIGEFKIIIIKENNKFLWKASKNNKILLKSDRMFSKEQYALDDARKAFK